MVWTILSLFSVALYLQVKVKEEKDKRHCREQILAWEVVRSVYALLYIVYISVCKCIFQGDESVRHMPLAFSSAAPAIQMLVWFRLQGHSPETTGVRTR